MSQFTDRLKKATQRLRGREIKPVAIISISIPYGKLSPYYDKEIVSGKAYGKSIRYHYKDGKFKLLSKEDDVKSRVVFLDYDARAHVQTLESNHALSSNQRHSLCERVSGPQKH